MASWVLLGCGEDGPGAADGGMDARAGDAGGADSAVADAAGDLDSGSNDGGGERSNCAPPIPINAICLMGSFFGGVEVLDATFESDGRASASSANSALTIRLGHAPTPGATSVSEGELRCEPGSQVFVELNPSGGGPGNVLRADAFQGSCRFDINRGGSFASDPLSGTFSATVSSPVGSDLTVRGRFRYE